MELRDCKFNRKAEIVCEEIDPSPDVDDGSNLPAIKESKLDLSTPPMKNSDPPEPDKKVV